MANDTDNVEQIAIQVDINDLKVKLASAKTDLKSFLSAMVDADKVAKQYGDTISSSTNPSIEALRQNAARAAAQVMSLQTEIKTATKTASAGLAESTARMEGFRLGTSGAIREFIVLGHELMVGNFSRIPGSMVVLTERMGNLGAVASFVTGPIGMAAAGIVALGAVTALAAYRAYEYEKRLEELTTRLVLLGQSEDEARGFIELQSEQLEHMSGLSSKAAKDILDLETSNASFSAALRSQITQTVPVFVKAYGDDAPAALKRFIDAADDLSLKGLQKLDHDTLHLSNTQYENIASMVASGHQAQALTELLKVLGDRGGANVNDLKTQVHQLEDKLKDLQQGARMAVGDLEDQPAWLQIQAEIRTTTEELNGLNAALHHAQLDDVQSAIRRELANAIELNNSLHERVGLLQNVRNAEAARDAAAATGADRRTIAILQTDVNERLAILQKFDKAAADAATRTDLHAFEVWKAGEDAKLQAYHVGSAQRLAILQEELSRAQALGEKGAEEVSRIQGRINAETRRSGDLRVATERRTQNQINQIDNEWFQTTMAISRARLDAEKASLEEQLAAGEITAARKTELLLQYAAEEYALDQRAIENTYANSAQTVADMEKEVNALLVLSEKYYAQRAALMRQFGREQQAEDRLEEHNYRTMISGILSAEDNFVKNIFSGRQNLVQSIIALAQDMVTKELSADLRYYTQSALLEALHLKRTKEDETGGYLVHLFNEDLKTAATVTGVAERTAATVAGAHEGSAVEQQAGEISILNDAKKAASGAYSALAGIPIIGPIIAPIGAAAAFVAVEAFGNLESFDVGTDYVPHDMLAMVHEGERITPAKYNNEKDIGDLVLNFQPTVHGHKQKSLSDLIEEQPYILIDWLQKNHRSGALRKVLKAQ